MPLIYVTGISGAGKSSVRRELLQRGYEAVGVDEDRYALWLDRRTGEERTYPAESETLDPHGWIADHEWVFDIDKVETLKQRVDRDASLVFLCGVAAREDEVWKYFDRGCALVIDEATIRARIELRDDNWFGKRQDELDKVLAWNDDYADTYRGFGAVVIDATRSISVVADEVIEVAVS